MIDLDAIYLSGRDLGWSDCLVSLGVLIGRTVTVVTYTEVEVGPLALHGRLDRVDTQDADTDNEVAVLALEGGAVWLHRAEFARASWADGDLRIDTTGPTIRIGGVQWLP